MNSVVKEKIIELVSKRSHLASVEQKACWFEELLYLFKKSKSNDPLIKKIIELLNSITFKLNRNMEELLNEKLDIFLKYLNVKKEIWQKRILTLIFESKKCLGEQQKISILGDVYFCSSELSSWARELHYLMQKLKEKGGIIEETLSLLEKAKVGLFEKDKLILDKNLQGFMLVKERYLDAIKR